MRRALNLSDSERWVSSIAGATIALSGVRRRSLRGALMAVGGVALLARGTSGHCPAYAAFGYSSARRRDTREALGGNRGIHIEESVTINRPVESLYALWRELETLPRFISGLTSVTPLEGRRSRWVATGPGGLTAEWDAEIINEIPNQLIAWKTVGDADVISAGSVRFVPSKARGETQVHVKLQYEPPGGKGGAAVAWLLGKEPGQLVREGLRRFKAFMEAAEAPTTAGQPRGRRR